MPVKTLNDALDQVDAATSALDTATSSHAAEVAALADRVRRDDISPADLSATLARISASAEAISANATAISGFTTSVAGIEPVSVEVPPVEEIPPIEEVPPVETTPTNGGGGGDSGGTPTP